MKQLFKKILMCYLFARIIIICKVRNGAERRVLIILFASQNENDVKLPLIF